MNHTLKRRKKIVLGAEAKNKAAATAVMEMGRVVNKIYRKVGGKPMSKKGLN
jgi:hypothetical protein